MGMTRDYVVPPPARVPVAVTSVPSVVGEALVLFVVDPATGNISHSYGYRGWRDMYEIAEGPVIEVVTEDEWHRHELLGTPPSRVRQWSARAAWIA